MTRDQGSVAIVEEMDENEARAPQIELRADLLERLFVTEGRSRRGMVRRFGRGVVDELLALGLEVDGAAPRGCVSSWHTEPTLPPQQSCASIEDCVVSYLETNPSARHDRVRMFPRK
jgi:hypothetical protein